MFNHVSVLLNETIEHLVTDSAGTYFDCTLGGAGHGQAICALLGECGRYVGIDRDPAAIAAARLALAATGCQVELVHANFSEIRSVAAQLELAPVAGVLFDLGVSSYQLDTPERGFSYMHDGPLDMRMDPTAELSAFTVVNNYPEADLSRLLFEYSDEKWSKRIAKFIVAERAKQPIVTTSHLVEVIKQAIPAGARRNGPHPAKRSFQAIRIAVNGELSILRQALLDSIQLLQPGGRICVISFHSLEDRIVKKTFRELAHPCTCPPSFPICICQAQPLIRLIGKPIVPTTVELNANPRARSAVLRIAERV